LTKTIIISVGKIKEKGAVSLIGEYEKRLSKYTDFSHKEIAGISVPDNPVAAEIENVLGREAAAILKAVPPKLPCVALTIDGRQMPSGQFSEFIHSRKLEGGVCFIIGSSHGLHKSVTDACGFKISLSKMTFPHNFARLILTEQIYRAHKIINNENYHK
jgi:23S rRNA (pseudouridine1915-N3)-methyltransferase